MYQREMSFFAKMRSPKCVDSTLINMCMSYREAVCLCWESRDCHGMTMANDQAACARLLGIYTSHFSCFVNRESGNPRDLPPDCIHDFELYCGNTAITQYLDSRRSMYHDQLKQLAA